MVQGERIAAPTTSLLLRAGAGYRLVFAARDPGNHLQAGVGCILLLGETVFADFVLDEQSAPLPMLLNHEVPNRLSLLRFLVGTCGALLRLTMQRDFALLCHGLAVEVSEEGAARALCRPGAALSLWRVPVSGPGFWHLISREGLRRAEPPGEDVLLINGRPPPADSLLLPPGPGARPVPLAPVPAKAQSLRDVVQDAIADSVEAPTRIAVALARRAPHDKAVAALLAEAQLLAPARPKALQDPAGPVGGAVEVAVSDHGGGIFLSGWLRDPVGLVAGLELRSAFATRLVPLQALHRLPRPDIADSQAGMAFGGTTALPGFALHLPAADHAAVAQWRLMLRLHSGESLELVAPPSRLMPVAARELVLGAVRPAHLPPGLLESAIVPTVKRLHDAAMARPAAPDVICIGPAAAARPRAAIIVPLYRNLRFLRFQLAAFARDAAIAGSCEIIFVLDSPEQRGEVEILLRGLAALHDRLSLTLLVMPENRGYASACNAGAAVATAPVLVMLNSDVLPARRGWFEPLLARLAAEPKLSAVGPKLLFDDGSLQHAGMFFKRGYDGEWLNYHYYKGFPRDFPAACVPRRVPAVTGAALVVRRRAFEAVGGFCTDYVVGDFEDSDLCLALRAKGKEIGYEPGVELLHFERQSIVDHGGHACTLAGAYNRHLHHVKWNATITTLMSRFGEEY